MQPSGLEGTIAEAMPDIFLGPSASSAINTASGIQGLGNQTGAHRPYFITAPGIKGLSHQTHTQVVNLRSGAIEHLCFDASPVSDRRKLELGLYLRSCSGDPHSWDLFVLPAAGKIGPIRPVRSPDFCLTKKSDSEQVSFQPCKGLPFASFLWSVHTASGSGDHIIHRLHLAASDSWCLGIPGWAPQAVESGSRPKMQNCSETDMRQALLMQPPPVDCTWDAWTSWSLCSKVCGEGHTTRARIILQHASFLGSECAGDWQQLKPCRLGTCSTTTVAATSMALGSPMMIPDTNASWAVASIFAALLVLAFVVWSWLQCGFAGSRKRVDSGSRILSAELVDRSTFDYRSVEQEDPDSIAASPPLMQDTGVQTKLVTCHRRHELREVTGSKAEQRWSCDLPQGCPSGCASKGLHRSGNDVRRLIRYRCDFCDFDLCEHCYMRHLDGPDAGGQSLALGAPSRAGNPASGRVGVLSLMSRRGWWRG